MCKFTVYLQWFAKSFAALIKKENNKYSFYG